MGRELKLLGTVKPATADGRLLVRELTLAARMAVESCRYLLWQQALAAGRTARARELSRTGLRNLARLKREFADYWPSRNKGTPQHCAGFLDWRMDDYRRDRLHYSPTESLSG